MTVKTEDILISQRCAAMRQFSDDRISPSPPGRGGRARRARQPRRSTTTTRPCRALSPCSFSLMLFPFELMLLPLLAGPRTEDPCWASSFCPCSTQLTHVHADDRELASSCAVSCRASLSCSRVSALYLLSDQLLHMAAITAHGCRTARRRHRPSRPRGRTSCSSSESL